MRRVIFAVAAVLAAMQSGFAADCSGEAVAKARSVFKEHYEARAFGAARDILNEVWNACFTGKRDDVLAAEIASDLAIAAHRAGDCDECLQILADFMPGFRGAERRLAALPERLRKAITFNIGLCEKQCPGVGPGCLTARVARAYGKLAHGDFSAAASCGFDAGAGAVALSPTLCLRVDAPKREVELGDRATAKPGEICPGLSVVAQDGRRRTIALGSGSWLRNAETCCAEISVETASDGRIRVAPAENPPEGCISGTRSFVAEEIFRLDSVTLKPLSRALIAVR